MIVIIFVLRQLKFVMFRHLVYDDKSWWIIPVTPIHDQ